MPLGRLWGVVRPVRVVLHERASARVLWTPDMCVAENQKSYVEKNMSKRSRCIK